MDDGSCAPGDERSEGPSKSKNGMNYLSRLGDVSEARDPAGRREMVNHLFDVVVEIGATGIEHVELKVTRSVT